MDFLGPQAVTSIANLFGIETRQDDEKYEPESVEVGGERDEEVSKYLIRQGADKDVLQGSVRRCQDNLDSIEKEICSDYTYADYKEEFERERSAEELYEDDIRAPVESEITEGQTYQAGRLPDKKFVLMKISLPDEDPKTIDVDVKSDKVLLFSYHYKCLAYWNTKIKPSLASTTWNGDTYILTVKAPIN